MINNDGIIFVEPTDHPDWQAHYNVSMQALVALRDVVDNLPGDVNLSEIRTALNDVEVSLAEAQGQQDDNVANIARISTQQTLNIASIAKVAQDIIKHATNCTAAADSYAIKSQQITNVADIAALKTSTAALQAALEDLQEAVTLIDMGAVDDLISDFATYKNQTNGNLVNLGLRVDTEKNINATQNDRLTALESGSGAGDNMPQLITGSVECDYEVCTATGEVCASGGILLSYTDKGVMLGLDVNIASFPSNIAVVHISMPFLSQKLSPGNVYVAFVPCYAFSSTTSLLVLDSETISQGVNSGGLSSEGVFTPVIPVVKGSNLMISINGFMRFDEIIYYVSG
jgi:hypothetical protein